MTNWGLTKTLSLDAGASYNIVKGNEPDRRINNITKAEEGYTLLRGNSQQRYFSTLDEDDINVKAGLIYRLKDNVEEISNIRLGYTGRFVDDNFKATEYNLTVGHASSIPHWIISHSTIIIISRISLPDGLPFRRTSISIRSPRISIPLMRKPPTSLLPVGL